MEPITSFEQRYAGVRRRFALQPDHVAEQGRKFGATFDVRHEFAALSPQVDSCRARAPLFYGGLVLIGCALAGFIALATQGNLAFPGALVLLSIIGVVGVGCVIFRAKPLRAFAFKNKLGGLAFEIIGVESEKVEQFATTIREQIQNANNLSRPGRPA